METANKPGFTSYAYSAVETRPRNPWRVSPVCRLPWQGFGALLIALIGVGASITILRISDGQPLRTWTWQPTVYLAIASTITNITLHFAFSEGLNVAWWRRAARDGTRIADLHRYWNHGNNLLAAATSGWHVNMIAVACILMALAPIYGPLLQRASTVITKFSQQEVDISVSIAHIHPDGHTGFISGRGHDLSLLSPEFATVVNAATTKSDIHVESSGCTGQCRAIVRGAGFAINCSTGTTPFSLVPGPNWKVGDGMPEATVFSSQFNWEPNDPGTLNTTISYKSSAACEGELQDRNCTMKAAIVEYPVIIDSNRSTIKLDPATTMFDDKIVEMTELTIVTSQGPSTLGGVYRALDNAYRSSINARFSGGVPYTISTSGATAQQYAILDPKDPASCSTHSKDPSQDLLQVIRDLMFRTAIAAANDTANKSDRQTVRAQQTSSESAYESHYLFLGLATLFTALAWIASLPIFIGW